MRHFIALLMMFCWISFDLTAQSNGQHVRVTSRQFGLHNATGSVLRVTVDSIVLARKADTLALPRSDIDRLDIRVRRGSRASDGAAIGTALGLAAGVVVAVNNRRECIPQDSFGVNCVYESFNDVGYEVAYVTLFSLAGAGLGALIGSAIPSHEWKTVAVGPLAAGRVGLGLAISF